MRVFIIAKTYPELSSKYGETVCTAGVDEAGNPLRLYPIPFRYLSGPQRFQRYQWIEASLTKSRHDSRPESHTLNAESIVLGEKVDATPDEWGMRADIVLKSPSWQFSSMQMLLEAQRKSGRSLAFIWPKSYTGVSIRGRAADDAKTFQEKLDDLKKRNLAARMQLDLFERSVPAAMKNLDMLGNAFV